MLLFLSHQAGFELIKQSKGRHLKTLDDLEINSFKLASWKKLLFSLSSSSFWQPLLWASPKPKPRRANPHVNQNPNPELLESRLLANSLALTHLLGNSGETPVDCWERVFVLCLRLHRQGDITFPQRIQKRIGRRIYRQFSMAFLEEDGWAD